MGAELRDVTVHIDTGRWSETVLDGMDIVVPDGQITALLGESGCGKSMVAAALNGRLPEPARSTGQVLVNGDLVQDRRHWLRLRGRTIGLLPQAGVDAFSPTETVGAQLRKLENRHRRWTLDDACAAAHYPTDLFDLYPGQHSGGQIQRAAFAAALLPGPDILVADEPTASLETDLAYEMWVTLYKYARSGGAVLAITHDVPMLTATQVADHLVLMRAGKVTATGDLTTLQAQTDPYTRGFFHP
ncbi:ABC transporter ATP-binding protein [Actinomadura darangshiensis]|uniref:Nickel import system ATP-binding protein NikD n=1 Tax=Actinomadura darangshiensis TaxID=705336 RepID=A0A4R5AM56_9ACTN|nr:ATP-binding cassette domain-containing protein [Actinomadura darangshiensis]TDD72114.1 ABC transporter ATP-binding protein [Actinomadura darangshiensis]